MPRLEKENSPGSRWLSDISGSCQSTFSLVQKDFEKNPDKYYAIGLIVATLAMAAVEAFY